MTLVFVGVDKYCSGCSSHRTSPQKTAHATRTVTRLM